jgi:hypothetical protein
MSMIPYCRHGRSYQRRRSAALPDPLESSRRYITRWLWLGGASFSAILGLLSSGPAEAWDRGDVHNFVTIPTFAPSGPGADCPNEAKSCTSDVEGVAVAPDGTVYSASYGYNRDGTLGGYGELFVFAPNGQLLTDFPVIGSSPHLIGLEYQQSSKGANNHTGKITRPECPDLRQIGQRLCLGLFSGRHLEDRPQRRHADGLVCADQPRPEQSIATRCQHRRDPEPAVRRERDRVQQRGNGLVRLEHRLQLDREDSDEDR